MQTTGFDMRRDVELALALASSRPTGPAVDALGARLKNYIEALAEPAEAYAQSLDGRARDLADSTIRQARNLARTSGGDPAATLRLLAKSVDCLWRYAQGAEQLQQEPTQAVRLPLHGGDLR